MLSHDNLIWTARATKSTKIENFKSQGGQPRGISYLPLSHVAAQFTDIILSLRHAGHVFFADANALKGTLIDYLLEVRPTAFVGVPRVWEKMEERVRSVLEKKKRILSWASHVGQNDSVRQKRK